MSPGPNRRRIAWVLALSVLPVVFPVVVLRVTRVPFGVASVLAAELIYAWLVALVVARRRLARRLGTLTAYAALGVLAAASLVPLAFSSPMCSSGLSSPWCVREIGSWALSGVLIAGLGLLCALARRLPGSVRAAHRQLAGRTGRSPAAEHAPRRATPGRNRSRAAAKARRASRKRNRPRR